MENKQGKIEGIQGLLVHVVHLRNFALFNAMLFELFLLLTSAATAVPVVPGFVVSDYATVSTPGGLSFDPTGVLYVGNLNNAGNVAIRRVALGGSPVQDYDAAVRDRAGCSARCRRGRH